VVVPALTPHDTPVRWDDAALLDVLEAYNETLRAENEILKRRLDDAEARAAREAAKAKEAIAELSALTDRLTTPVPRRTRRWWRPLSFES
jgi:hypothetical protein